MCSLWNVLVRLLPPHLSTLTPLQDLNSSRHTRERRRNYACDRLTLFRALCIALSLSLSLSLSSSLSLSLPVAVMTEIRLFFLFIVPSSPSPGHLVNKSV